MYGIAQKKNLTNPSILRKEISCFTDYLVSYGITVVNWVQDTLSHKKIKFVNTVPLSTYLELSAY
jgi:hypothetical protein